MSRPRRRRCGQLAVLLCASTLAAAPLSAATFVFTFGEGFNNPTPATPISGNAGTTVGQQARNALTAAGNMWGSVLQSTIPIRVNASFAPLACTANGAVVGVGRPDHVFRNSTNTSLQDTWYPASQANALAGRDLDPSSADIEIVFNSRLGQSNCLQGGSFYFGLNSPPPPGGAVFFLAVALHELAHGLGFASGVNAATGELLGGFRDVFSTRLEDHSRKQTWPQLNNAQRQASAIDTNDLHWLGPNVIEIAGDILQAGANAQDHVRMFAPNPLQGGSSVSHWDTSVMPNELMEPVLTNDGMPKLTLGAFSDMGWPVDLEGIGPCVASGKRLCLGVGGRFRVDLFWRDPQGNSKNADALAFGRDSGLFYFLARSNIEMLVKVLNGCGINGHFWVFYAATTDLEFVLRVTDTQTDLTRTYSNHGGNAARTILDVFGLQGCPGGGFAGSISDPESLLMTELPAVDGASARSGWPAPIALGVEPQPTAVAAALDAPHDLRLEAPAVAHSIGLFGERFNVDISLARDFNGDGHGSDEIFTLVGGPPGSGGAGNVVTFNNAQENLNTFFGSTTRPRVQEQTRQLPGRILELTFTLTSNNNGDLFPAGYTFGGTPLTDGVLFLGRGSGSNPLEFSNLGVTGATVQLIAAGAAPVIITVEPDQLSDFFTDPWDGRFGIILPNRTGRGYNRIVITILVEVSIAELPDVAPFTCQQNGTTLCINGGRFRVRATWRTAAGDTGPAMRRSIPGAPDSGTFYFFDENNVELLNKVLNGCGINNHYWFFNAATTDVEFTVTVTDSETGKGRQYFNPLGNIANAVTDTQAFATCP